MEPYKFRVSGHEWLFQFKSVRAWPNHLVCITETQLLPQEQYSVYKEILHEISKNLNVRTMTWSKFHIENPQLLGATVQNLVAKETCRPKFVNLWYKELLYNFQTAVRKPNNVPDASSRRVHQAAVGFASISVNKNREHKARTNGPFTAHLTLQMDKWRNRFFSNICGCYWQFSKLIYIRQGTAFRWPVANVSALGYTVAELNMLQNPSRSRYVCRNWLFVANRTLKFKSQQLLYSITCVKTNVFLVRFQAYVFA